MTRLTGSVPALLFTCGVLVSAQSTGPRSTVGALLRQSAEVLAFAGCGARDAAGKTQAAPDRWCEQLQSK